MLDVEEYIQVICCVVDQVKGCILVIVGIGVNFICEVVVLIEVVKSGGVDVCLLVMLYYNKLIQEGMYQYFCYIVEVVVILQIFYNVLGCIFCDMFLEIVECLFKVLNIIGIKEVIGDL